MKSPKPRKSVNMHGRTLGMHDRTKVSERSCTANAPTVELTSRTHYRAPATHSRARSGFPKSTAGAPTVLIRISTTHSRALLRTTVHLLSANQ